MEKKIIGFRPTESDLEQLEIIKKYHERVGFQKLDTTTLLRFALFYCASQLEENEKKRKELREKGIYI